MSTINARFPLARPRPFLPALALVVASALAACSGGPTSPHIDDAEAVAGRGATHTPPAPADTTTFTTTCEHTQPWGC